MDYKLLLRAQCKSETVQNENVDYKEGFSQDIESQQRSNQVI